MVTKLLALLTKAAFPNYIKVAVKAEQVKSSSSRDVVCILGWGGSSQKNLTRLREYYLSKPTVHSVVSFVMPMGVPLFCRDALEESLLSHLQKQAVAAASGRAQDEAPGDSSSSAKSRLLCHVFSNNGAWVYGAVDCHMLREGRGPLFEKVIVDSAPYLVYESKSVFEEASILSRVLTSVVLQKNVYEHRTVTPIVKAIYIPYAIASRVFEFIQDHIWTTARFVPKMKELNLFLRDRLRVVPTLFIYSRGDKLIPPSAVQEFVGEYSKRSVDAAGVREIEYGDNVAHVGGFWVEGEAYKKEIDRHFGL